MSVLDFLIVCDRDAIIRIVRDYSDEILFKGDWTEVPEMVLDLHIKRIYATDCHNFTIYVF